MVLRNELPQIGGAEILPPLAERVVQIEGIHDELIRRENADVVRDAPRHPVMPADRLEPPDLIRVVERDAVRFVGAVLFEQGRQPEHALPRRADVGQHEHDDILLADAAGGVRLAAFLRLFVFHERIRRQHTGIRGDRLRGSHADVRRVDPGRRPDPVLRVDARTGGVAQGILGQFDLEVREDGLVFLRLILRLDDDHLLDVEEAVVRAGDHGGAVVRGVLSDQNGGAGHGVVSFYIFL